VGRCVDPQLAAAFWIAQGAGGSPAVVVFNLATVALVAPAALTADGLAVLQSALPCAASAALGLASNGSALMPGVVGGGSVAVLSSSAYTATLQRASLQLALLAANTSAGAAAPPAWAGAVAAQVAGGGLAAPRLLPVLAACVAALHLPASSQAAAAAWAQALSAPSFFSVGAAQNASVPAAFVTIEQELAARAAAAGPAAGTGAASGGGDGSGGFSSAAGLGVGVAIVLLVLAGGAYLFRGAGAGGGGGKKLRRRPQFEAAGEEAEQVEEGEAGRRSQRASFNPIAAAASGRHLAAAAAAGAGWLQCENAATGQVWFVDQTSGTTMWDLPPGAVVTKWMKQ
jgi:hypothetical protein